MSTSSKLRRRAGGVLFDGFFNSFARLGRLYPGAHPKGGRIEVIEDVAYAHGGGKHHQLDIYQPVEDRRGPHPVVLYVHGGGFRILSKNTHWMMGMAFARKGYLVFNINYRLAPRHPYPAALSDAAHALLWVHTHAARYGGDPSRIVLAGESAGANLVTALAVAAAWRRPEPFARAIFDRGIVPRAVVPACGVFQVSDAGRFARRKPMPRFISDRIDEVERSYLAEADRGQPGGLELADPLVVLEKSGAPDRPLAPMFTFVGTRDPLLDDTRRLHAAMTARGARCDVAYYPGEVHAFHAMMWRDHAIAAWKKTFEFLGEMTKASHGNK